MSPLPTYLLRTGSALWIGLAAVAWALAHAEALLPLRVGRFAWLLAGSALAAGLVPLFTQAGKLRVPALAGTFAGLTSLLAIGLGGEITIVPTVLLQAGLVLCWFLVTATLGSPWLARSPAPWTAPSVALACAAGTGTLMVFALLLASMGRLSLPWIGSVVSMVLLGLGCTERTRELWRWFWGGTIMAPKALPERLLAGTLATLVAAAFLDNLAPIPRGWDGLTQYFLVARQIAETGSIVPSTLSTGYELLAALGLVVSGSTPFGLVLCGFVPALLGLACLHAWLATSQSRLASLIGTLVIATLPLWTFQAVEESKVDLAALAFVAAALLALAQSRKGGLGGALLGLAAAVKITTALAGIAIFLGFAASRRSLSGSLRLATLGTLAFLPFGVQRLHEAGEVSVRAFLLGGSPRVFVDWQKVTDATALPPASNAISGTQLELARYGHDLEAGVTAPLLWPWRATLQSDGVKRAHVDPGFAPLALLPLALLGGWLVLRHPRSAQREDLMVMLFAVLFWTLWALTCKQILWYGLPGFLAFAYVAARYADAAPRAMSLCAISLLCGLWLATRASSLGKPLLLHWAAGTIDAATCEAEALPLAGLVRSTLRADPEALVVAAGTPYSWAVPRAAYRVQADPYLDLLDTLARERDPTLLRQRLELLGLRYVLLDRNLFEGGAKAGMAARIARVEWTLAQAARLLGESRQKGHAFYALR